MVLMQRLPKGLVHSSLATECMVPRGREVSGARDVGIGVKEAVAVGVGSALGVGVLSGDGVGVAVGVRMGAGIAVGVEVVVCSDPLQAASTSAIAEETMRSQHEVGRIL